MSEDDLPSLRGLEQDFALDKHGMRFALAADKRSARIGIGLKNSVDNVSHPCDLAVDVSF
jgi:hypothetical protein